jgi:hypothetical protein
MQCPFKIQLKGETAIIFACYESHNISSSFRDVSAHVQVWSLGENKLFRILTHRPFFLSFISFPVFPSLLFVHPVVTLRLYLPSYSLR